MHGAVRRKGRRYHGRLPASSDRSLPDLGEREAFLVRTSLVHWYRRFPMLDPGLPDGGAGPRSRAAEVFDDVYRRLAEPAQRHFDELTSSVQGRAPAAPVH